MEKPKLPMLANLRKGLCYERGRIHLFGASLGLLHDLVMQIKLARPTHDEDSCDEAMQILQKEADRQKIDLNPPLCACGRKGLHKDESGHVFCGQPRCRERGFATVRRQVTQNDRTRRFALEGAPTLVRLKRLKRESTRSRRK